MAGSWSEDPRLPVEPLDAALILRTLIAHEVEFLLIGGLAVAAHGFTRGTKDVDVVPAPGRENRRRLYAALSELHAKPVELGELRPEELPVQFAPEGLDEGGNWALSTDAGRVDLMQWIPGIDRGYDQLLPGAITDEVPGVGPVRFAGYDDLLTMKRAAGRPQDTVDLDQLERIRRDAEA